MFNKIITNIVKCQLVILMLAFIACSGGDDPLDPKPGGNNGGDNTPGPTTSKPVYDFPKTEADVERSVSMANAISARFDVICDSLKQIGKYDIDVVASVLEKNPNVLKTFFNKNKTTLSFIQRDRLILNILLDTPDLEDNTFDNVTSNMTKSATDFNYTSPLLTVSTNKAISQFNTRSGFSTIYSTDNYSINNGGKALILAPFQHSFEENMEKIKSELSPYFNSSPVYLPDDNAGITAFTGSFLKNYDLILISTHGGTSYKCMYEELNSANLKNADDFTKYQIGNTIKDATSLLTSTEYNPINVKRYILDGDFQWNQIALARTSTRDTFRMCMTPDFLSGQSLDNAYVIITSCHGAEIEKGTLSLQ